MQTAPTPLTDLVTDPFPTPIDVSRVKDEKGVKKIIKAILDHFGWFHWMPGANGFGQQGVSDHLALKTGVFIAIEAKFGTNKPRPLQKAFAAQILANDAYAFCVTERNVEFLAQFLESFEVARECQMRGKPIPDDHGSRMVNAISVLTDAFRG